MRSKLFTQCRLGPVKLANRALAAAVFENLCPGHEPSKELIQFHKSVASGGAAMTSVACAAVSSGGIGFENQLLLSKAAVSNLKKLTSTVHRAGALAAIQLEHSGALSRKALCGQMPLSASTGFNALGPAFVRGMTSDEAIEAAKAFGSAAALAADAGFDAVEIQAGQGGLISQFLSPYTNRRKDELGGSLQNRMLFLRMVIDEVMEATGRRTAVIVRINMQDGFKGGLSIDEALEIGRFLESMGVHGLILTEGFAGKSPVPAFGKPPAKAMIQYMPSRKRRIYYRMFGRLIVKKVPFKEACFWDDALEFRKALSLPLVYSGCLADGSKINEILNMGFDFVALGRALLREPGFINRLKKDSAAVSFCGHGNYCFAGMYGLSTCCPKLPELS